MRHFIFIGIFIFLSQFVFSQENELLTYNSSVLNWTHYAKSEKPSGYQNAFTYCGINYVVHATTHGYLVVYESFVDLSSSWVLRGKESKALLRHEQGLFDLTELYARKMNKQISDYMKQQKNLLTYETLSEMAKKIYKEQNNKLFQEQLQYNAQTNNGLNELEQTRWEQKVNTELTKLESFRTK